MRFQPTRRPRKPSTSHQHKLISPEHRCCAEFRLRLDAVITAHTQCDPHLPAIDAQHHDARYVETDATGDDRIRWGEVQRARRIHLALVLVDERVLGSMQAERNGHKGDEAGQQPNGDDRADRHATCHPTAVSV